MPGFNIVNFYFQFQLYVLNVTFRPNPFSDTKIKVGMSDLHQALDGLIRTKVMPQVAQSLIQFWKSFLKGVKPGKLQMLVLIKAMSCLNDRY